MSINGSARLTIKSQVKLGAPVGHRGNWKEKKVEYIGGNGCRYSESCFDCPLPDSGDCTWDASTAGAKNRRTR